MKRSVEFTVAVLALLFAPLAQGAEVTIEGVLKAVNAETRLLTVDRKTATGMKELSLEVAKEAGDLSSLKPGEDVAFSYDSTLEVVTKIIAPVKEATWLFYDFMCQGVTMDKGLQGVSDEELRCLSVAESNRGPFVLVTSKEYESCVFRCEFYYEEETMDGNPFVGIASALPPMQGKTFGERNPKGIEVKLWHRGFGSLLLPNETFKAEMVYGQKREKQAVFPLKQQVPTRNGWSTLEIEVKADKTILVKGNGVLLNAIAKAENTKGHIVVFPPACDFRIRNASIEVDEEKTPLPFSSMTAVPCK